MTYRLIGPGNQDYITKHELEDRVRDNDGHDSGVNGLLLDGVPLSGLGSPDITVLKWTPELMAIIKNGILFVTSSNITVSARFATTTQEYMTRRFNRNSDYREKWVPIYTLAPGDVITDITLTRNETGVGSSTAVPESSVVFLVTNGHSEGGTIYYYPGYMATGSTSSDAYAISSNDVTGIYVSAILSVSNPILVTHINNSVTPISGIIFDHHNTTPTTNSKFLQVYTALKPAGSYTTAPLIPDGEVIQDLTFSDRYIIINTNGKSYVGSIDNVDVLGLPALTPGGSLTDITPMVDTVDHTTYGSLVNIYTTAPMVTNDRTTIVVQAHYHHGKVRVLGWGFNQYNVFEMDDYRDIRSTYESDQDPVPMSVPITLLQEITHVREMLKIQPLLFMFPYITNINKIVIFGWGGDSVGQELTYIDTVVKSEVYWTNVLTDTDVTDASSFSPMQVSPAITYVTPGGPRTLGGKSPYPANGSAVINISGFFKNYINVIHTPEFGGVVTLNDIVAADTSSGVMVYLTSRGLYEENLFPGLGAMDMHDDTSFSPIEYGSVYGHMPLAFTPVKILEPAKGY